MAGTWVYEGATTEGESLRIDGIDVWAHAWRRVQDAPVTVVDPHYGQQHEFHVYTIEHGGVCCRFAAGEFSNGIWGFYRPA